MVFFTCNACGSSLKKNQVEKHYQNECRNCSVLSCIDCGQDFYGYEYVSHTKCISEAEKYQGAMFKGSGNKGEKKQQEWLERARSAVKGAKVNPRISSILDRISEYPNIPRKKPKFQNFIRNSLNVRDQGTLDQVWAIFNQDCPSPAAEPDVSETQIPANSDRKQMERCGAEDGGISEGGASKTQLNGAGDQEKDVLESSKKRKGRSEGTFSQEGGGSQGAAKEESLKKKKRRKRTTDKDQEGDGSQAVAMDLKSLKKKKKREKIIDKDHDVEGDRVNGEIVLENTVSEDSKEVKKKKKRKREALEVKHEESLQDGEGEMGETWSKRKSTKTEVAEENGIGIASEQETVPSNSECLQQSLKKKKKKKKDRFSGENVGKKPCEMECGDTCGTDRCLGQESTEENGSENAKGNTRYSVEEEGPKKKRRKRKSQLEADSLEDGDVYSHCNGVQAPRRKKQKLEIELKNNTVGSLDGGPEGKKKRKKSHKHERMIDVDV